MGLSSLDQPPDTEIGTGRYQEPPVFTPLSRPCKARLTAGLLVIGVCTVAAADPASWTVGRVAIVTGKNSPEPELKAAKILASRILKRSQVALQSAVESDAKLAEILADAELVFVVGSPQGNRRARQLMQELDTQLPTLPNSTRIHPESFVVKSGLSGGKPCVVIAGSDPRAAIYGVGAALRAMTFLPEKLVVPALDLRDKPAFWMRGGQPSGPGSRARQFGKLRPRTSDEQLEMMEDYMLLGTNIFGGDPKFIRSYGMMTVFGRTANEMPRGFPKAWTADDGHAPQYVCPSIPEARKALLASFDEMFRNAPDYDFFTTNSGDEGGCRCEKCSPWGGTYIRLLREIAERLHKYHPNTKILATNQDLDNAGNQQIFDYLNSQDSSWLFAIRYGPGADEMQTYIRGPVNPRWFAYEGFGPLGNYLKYMHHVLPRTTTIALYSDITHWMQAQYAVRHPDVALAAVYQRRSWNARPRNFQKVANEILHYAVGDIHYSEGMHDDFNKWFWYRKLWNPNLDAQSLTQEYCRYWFGPAAQHEAARAIFLMEETLEKPVVGNPGIAEAVELLRSAGKKIPENLLRIDWRWRVMSEKALMDLYIQQLLERGQALKRQAAASLERAEGSQQPAGELAEALRVLGQPLASDSMKALMAEAKQRGEEANRVAGYREPVVFLVDQFDLTEVGWWKQTLQRALASGDDRRMRNTARMVLHYAEPGRGGFYDALGWPNDPQHLVNGQWQWGFMPFAGPAKRSHYSLAYTFFEPRGVTLKYDHLDPAAQYVVRLSIGVHGNEAARRLEGIELKECLKANGKVISQGFAIPRGDVVYPEFELPRQLTRGGSLEIALTGASKRLPLTAAHEVWLMRKDQMPWTAQPGQKGGKKRSATKSGEHGSF